MIINNIHDLAAHFGTSVERLERDFYKYTECGAWIRWDDNSVTFGTIVEGSDAEFSDDLLFPFNSEYFDDCLAEIENQADMAWHEANDDEWDRWECESSHDDWDEDY